MKVVVDTNVLVSGLKRRSGTPPGEVVDDLLSGALTLLFDARILAEYEDVLGRPRLKLSKDAVTDLLSFIRRSGVNVPDGMFAGTLTDRDDQPFADVAFTGGADLLITGNTADFPVGDAIRIRTPREYVELKSRMALAQHLGEDPRFLLDPPKPYLAVQACLRCRIIRTFPVLNLVPRLEPERLPVDCREPDAARPDGVCGGELWSYDDNDLGRRLASARGIPIAD